MRAGNDLDCSRPWQKASDLESGDSLYYASSPASGRYPYYSPALQPGDHLYYSYEQAADQLPLLVEFIRGGLHLGQQCIYVADDLSEKAVEEALEKAGCDVRADKEDAALRFLRKWEWRQGEELDLALMVQGLASLVSQGHRAGYSGIRIWKEMTWALNPRLDPLQLEAWEVLLHQMIEGEPVVVVCSYNSRRLPKSVIKAGESTHPWRATGGRVLPNDRCRLPALFAKHAKVLRDFDLSRHSLLSSHN